MSRYRPGDQVGGRFTIEGWLAAGGMAEVYVAMMSGARGVQRRVALKRIHANMAEDPHFLAMFLDEARLAAQLSHPGVVPVQDVVEADGELLLVLDYVPGWDLGSVLKRARETGLRIEDRACLAVGRALAETLAYVHQARDLAGRPLGIVHRDVNPSNVLLAEDGTVRLLDFGVAKAAQKTAHTATRSIKGKLAYLAPEQAAHGRVDPRTDLYGLGLILYEMAAGARALQATGDLELLEAARDPRIPPARSLRPELAAELEALIGRLLARDPAERPASAAEAARVLDQLRAPAGEPAKEAVRALVERVMPAPSRTARTAQRPLDQALAAVVGVGPGEPQTGSLPAAPPLARGTGVARSLLASREPDTLKTPPPRRRRAGLLSLALGLLVLAGVTIAWGLERGRAPQPAPSPAPARGLLLILTEPPGAAVRLDGQDLAERTPTAVDSEAGVPRRVEVNLSDHVAASTTARAIAGSTTSVSLRLARRPGRLILRAHPQAQVWLDGRAVGRTPLELEAQPRAPVKVRFEAPGHQTEERVASLDAQAEVMLEAELVPLAAMGLLDVSSTPWARVEIDGRLVAESTPAIGLRLPVGRHTVVLTNPRLSRQERRVVQISQGARASVIVRFDGRQP